AAVGGEPRGRGPRPGAGASRAEYARAHAAGGERRPRRAGTATTPALTTSTAHAVTSAAEKSASPLATRRTTTGPAICPTPNAEAKAAIIRTPPTSRAS